MLNIYNAAFTPSELFAQIDYIQNRCKSLKLPVSSTKCALSASAVLHAELVVPNLMVVAIFS